MKKYISLVLTAVLFLGGSIGMLLGQKETSESERRKLAQWSGVNLDNYEDAAEDAAMDQFPFRDALRQLKAISEFSLFQKGDNNDFYYTDGSIGKIEYPLNETSVNNAINKFNQIVDSYLRGTRCKVYFAIVPDKSYYLAAPNGYLAMDYDKLYAMMEAGLDMTHIDLRHLLNTDSYYATDPHWRQEKLLPVAQEILTAMGAEGGSDYTSHVCGGFKGVYYSQLGLPLPSEQLTYLTSDVLDHCTVYNQETNETLGIYDLAALEGRDPYEMYLHGSAAYLTITNPNATTNRELVIFRDSFGSSIAPLLVDSYAKITLIDTRYVMPQMLRQFIQFKDQDILFLYSTLVLNSSASLK